MTNIKVLYTGGTIGSIKVKQTVSGKDAYQIMTRSMAREKGFDIKNSQSLLVEMYKSKYKSNINFYEEEISDVLSENMTISRWNAITDYLRNFDSRNFDGIIITHGTDTLGYFANYLSMILNNVDIPVMVVSSNYEITDSRANGIFNFKAACDFIDNVCLPGVFVPYRYNDKNKILYGSRVLQCFAPQDDFGCITMNGNIPLGIINDNGNFEVVDKQLYSEIDSRSRYSFKEKNLIDEFKTLNSKLLVIEPYVGLDYTNYNLKNVDAILHTLYHSGTACTDKDALSCNINNFLKNVRSNGGNESDIGFFVGPIYGKENRDLYASSSELVDNRANFIMNTSKENAYAKLLIAYSIAKGLRPDLLNKYVDNFMITEFNNEFIQKDKVLRK